MKKLIDLDELRKLQEAGGVLNTRPKSFDNTFDLPDDLLTMWKSYIYAKKMFNLVLEKYNIKLIQ